MTDVLTLYREADQAGVPVYWFEMEAAESLSIMDQDGSCAIALDPWYLRTVAEEKTKLAHELGHCKTGSFYNRWAALDVRQKHENRADKWAIQQLIPQEELDQAMSAGCREPWELAEAFGVTEGLIRKALCWYAHGNLAVEMYV